MIAILLALTAAAPAPFHCGAVERPGIAERGQDGEWRGAALDLCRQAAHGQAIAFRPYRQIADLRDAPHDALVVLSRAELAIALPSLQPFAPPVATSRQVLLVHPNTSLHSQPDLANHRVCFIIATPGEAALNAWARPAHVAIEHVGFQEPIELRDAFDAGYCTAIAVDAQDIPGGAGNSVQLGAPLSELPLFAVKASESKQ